MLTVFQKVLITVVGEYHYDDADLTKCSQNKPGSSYPDFGSRFGYLHSFGLTEKYVVLPEAGYMHDPCFYSKSKHPFHITLRNI
jgi:hypothetical protein